MKVNNVTAGKKTEEDRQTGILWATLTRAQQLLHRKLLRDRLDCLLFTNLIVWRSKLMVLASWSPSQVTHSLQIMITNTMAQITCSFLDIATAPLRPAANKMLIVVLSRPTFIGIELLVCWNMWAVVYFWVMTGSAFFFFIFSLEILKPILQLNNHL